MVTFHFLLDKKESRWGAPSDVKNSPKTAAVHKTFNFLLVYNLFIDALLVMETCPRELHHIQLWCSKQTQYPNNASTTRSSQAVSYPSSLLSK